MSFILDALKKLEHKQKRGSVPDLLTIHEQIPQEAKKQPFRLYLLAAVLLLNAAILLVWFMPWVSEKIKEQAALPEIKRIEEKLSPVVENPVAGRIERLAEDSIKPNPAAKHPVSVTPPPSAKTNPAENIIPHPTPQVQKKELPALSITGHIYSNEPASRMVNINGRIIREGETVSEGLKVEEITPDGVILDYEGDLFTLRAF